jgi:hypothetical protein
MLFSPIAMLKLHKEYLHKREIEIRENLADFQELIKSDCFKEDGCVTKNFSRFIAW